MAKGQMRSNKEKKKPKADKNLKKGGRGGQSVRGRQDRRRAEPEQEELDPGFHSPGRERGKTSRPIKMLASPARCAEGFSAHPSNLVEM